MVRPVQQAAGSGEVKTWRGGDFVKAGAETILNTLAETGLLIYPRGYLLTWILRIASKPLRLLHGRVGDSTIVVNSSSAQMSDLVEDTIAS